MNKYYNVRRILDLIIDSQSVINNTPKTDKKNPQCFLNFPNLVVLTECFVLKGGNIEILNLSKQL